MFTKQELHYLSIALEQMVKQGLAGGFKELTFVHNLGVKIHQVSEELQNATDSSAKQDSVPN